MNIWIQSLSWTLIYALGQGLLVYATLRIILKLTPSSSAGFRYHLSLSALTILLAWFAGTWWRQYHLIQATDLLISNNTPILNLPTYSAVDDVKNAHYSLSSISVIFPWLSAFYITGLTLMLMRSSVGLLQLLSLRKSGITQPHPTMYELLINQKSKIKHNGYVQLLISAKAVTPMVIGFIKPIILLPAATLAQLSTEQLETILLHELAHIKRYDYLVNILQTIAETVLFFNPFVWLITAINRQEREHCCDDLVLAHTNEPINYARALATLAAIPTTNATIIVAATGQSTHLFNRIKRIMEMKKTPLSYSRIAATLIIVATITLATAWMKPTLPTAHTEKQDSAATIVPKAAEKSELKVDMSEEQHLVQLLSKDGLISEVKGFVIERNKAILYINGVKQAEEVAGKYLPSIKKEALRIQVFSLQQRMEMHPEAGFLRNLLPMTLESPCVEIKPAKPGC